MPKLCLHCFRKISLLAGRCPYCLEEHQGVWGRLFLVLLVIAGFWMAYRYTSGLWPF